MENTMKEAIGGKITLEDLARMMKRKPPTTGASGTAGMGGATRKMNRLRKRLGLNK